MASNSPQKLQSPSIFSRLCNWWQQSPSRPELNYYAQAHGYGKVPPCPPDLVTKQVQLKPDASDLLCNSCQLGFKKYALIKDILPSQLRDAKSRDQRVCAVEYLLNLKERDQGDGETVSGYCDKNLTCVRQGMDSNTCVRQEVEMSKTYVKRGIAERTCVRQPAGTDVVGGLKQKLAKPKLKGKRKKKKKKGFFDFLLKKTMSVSKK